MNYNYAWEMLLSLEGHWVVSNWVLSQDRCNRQKRFAKFAGGTGISPMIQIIRSVFFHNRMDISLNLMYGAADESELVYKDLLVKRESDTDGWLKTY
jgi:ferredoxin-NADP reductase